MSKKIGLIERVAAEHGYRDATKLMLFVASWAYCCEQLGREPESVDEYCDWWRMDRRKGFREQELLRRCVPELLTPTPLWERLRREHPELLKRPVARLAVQLGAVL